MTDTKHTPGPWKVRFARNGYPYQIETVTDNSHPGGIKGVTRWAGISMPSSQEGLANARLMAAGPELFADAKRRVRECKTCGGVGRVRRPHGFFTVERECPDCGPTRAAIQKASGEDDQ